MIKACAIVPAYNAAQTVGVVVDGLRSLDVPILVVDDGSTDGTSSAPEARGAVVVRPAPHRGKGAALRPGRVRAKVDGMNVAVTVDADGQHPFESARAVLDASDDPSALVLGVRNLEQDGAPARNRFGNSVSNFFLSHFAGRTLRDTQCGLRRYPVVETLALGARSHGFAFEGEIVLRALAAGIRLVEIPIKVVYPPEDERRTHFRGVVDPARIVMAVVSTVLELRYRGR